MNIIKFFEDVTGLWNTENKCGKCWSFSAPLSESGLNATQATDDDKCCVYLFVTYYKTSAGYRTAQNGLKNREWCDHIFTLFVVKQSEIDLNIYNEQPFHPIEDSIWKTVIEPLQNCLG
ncbi:MAG: hypothetical protein ACRC8Z_10875, partial [Empedobacter falsenii]